jgi:hypothetical protein
MHTIGNRPRDDASGDPGTALRACHERIRRFLTTAGRVASVEPTTAKDLAEAAAAVARYFREALPLHEQDEEASIAPRLRDAALAEEIRAEHEVLHAATRALIHACERIAGAPDPIAARDDNRQDLVCSLAALSAAMLAHLAAEESRLLPAVDALPPAERAAIAAEMRARRGGAS